MCCCQDEACNEYDKFRVVEACKRTLGAIRGSRYKVHERQIEREMKKKKFFFGRHFTRDEAIARLKEATGITSTWSYTEALFGNQERTAELILFAAEKSVKDTFWLTKSEAGRLKW